MLDRKVMPMFWREIPLLKCLKRQTAYRLQLPDRRKENEQK
jgi:hypothetical protein